MSLTTFTRIWAMPSADTFDIAPIGQLVKRYLRASKVSVDPFARNKRWATYTNDLNPETAAEYHMDALEFLDKLNTDNVKADLFLFDPPYSPRQIQECYQGVGREVTMQDTQNSRLYSEVRKRIHPIMDIGGIVISCGWNSHGMNNSGGKGWEFLEGLLVCHGAAHNDTIVTVERKIAHQPELLSC